MMVFITGGSASGKSEYAGKLAERMAALYSDGWKILYVATLADRSEESEKRIERHRQLRRNGNYEVEECYTLKELKRLAEKESARGLDSGCPENPACSCRRVILFDSLDGFTADVLFRSDGSFVSPMDPGRLAADTADALISLAAGTSVFIVVSDALYSDGILYDEMTCRYMDYTAKTEQMLADAADHVIEVVCGIPLLLKGENDESLQIADYNVVFVHENTDAIY